MSSVNGNPMPALRKLFHFLRRSRFYGSISFRFLREFNFVRSDLFYVVFYFLNLFPCSPSGLKKFFNICPTRRLLTSQVCFLLSLCNSALTSIVSSNYKFFSF